MSSELPEPVRLSSASIMELPELKSRPWRGIIGEYLGSTVDDTHYHFAIQVDKVRYRISVPLKTKEHGFLEVVEIIDDIPFREKKKHIRLKILFTDNPDVPVKIERIQ